MYVEHFELLDYFIANGIEDTRKKRVVLLTLSGASTYKLIRNLSAPIKPAEKSFDDLVALLKSHYTPKPSVIMQRFQFHSRTQRPGETVAAFIAELRQLSEFCEFGATPENMLRDRLVCGIASSAIQRRLLAELDLTLKKAQDLAQAIESADKGSTEIFASNSEKSGSGHGSHVAASAMGGCGHRGMCTYVSLSAACARANLVVKSNSRETHLSGAGLQTACYNVFA